ncbi:MAG: long-chain fatty acid--CoA ligase [Cytophagales bacterium]|nr:MAG: long-chain fatty acid--CoA ligase [Cytophagales bacterium]TAF62055.1 MAG: long-chain fatty acid--CoA ligase [Cytophagales bacterium]
MNGLVSMNSILAQIASHAQNPQRVAIIDEVGEHTYAQLWLKAELLAHELCQKYSSSGFAQPFIIEPSAEYVVVLWAIWRAGGIAVPIHPKHPPQEVAYILDDLGGADLLQSADCQQTECCTRAIPQNTDSALIIYTSGSTGKPKGAVHSFESLESHITTLVEAWAWQANDAILNVLPLHHVHGLVNVLCCAIWSGARCYMMPKFDAKQAVEAFSRYPLTLFMAVPTIYSHLINYLTESDEVTRTQFQDSCQKFRLMVSGSAALSPSLLKKWHELTGHFLLERYGMTETGMMLSNPLHGERKIGSVGVPLPNVQIRLVSENQEVQTTTEAEGEIQTRGRHLFKHYWNKASQTLEAFSQDGWFRTGDMARRDLNGFYYILGRLSTDIIKTAGYKVSALEIENKLLEHPLIKECAVVALEDDVYGEVVTAALVSDSELDTESLKRWAKSCMAAYKVPQKWFQLSVLPRNSLGKVVKNDLKKRLLVL